MTLFFFAGELTQGSFAGKIILGAIAPEITKGLLTGVPGVVGLLEISVFFAVLRWIRSLDMRVGPYQYMLQRVLSGLWLHDSGREGTNAAQPCLVCLGHAHVTNISQHTGWAHEDLEGHRLHPLARRSTCFATG